MDGDRTARAMARIEAASARIAAAARQRPSPDNGLMLRHSRLRAEAGAALAELDTLIAGLET